MSCSAIDSMAATLNPAGSGWIWSGRSDTRQGIGWVGDGAGVFSRLTGRAAGACDIEASEAGGVCAVDDSAKGINTPSNPDATGRKRRRLLFSFIVIDACKLRLSAILAPLFTIAQTRGR
ncbi:hypothetical protein STPYR_11485 [uncultured Stenotrophomonas sp.]|uniref:Uncharacterized protein n=1 Tax=uncultured Stenotrophomonas sp. TaxID=165438 RepID=A0A1Y5Q745_9GAMM|nr:hypothetical protein STPYR_11485 [uncultured Stenotrophomonas sp.]